MTTHTIPAANCLRHLHDIARRNGLTISIDPVHPDHAVIYAMAVERVNELTEAVYDAWSDFVGRGIS